MYSESLALTRKASRTATPKGAPVFAFFLDDLSLGLRVTHPQYLVVRVALPEDGKDVVRWHEQLSQLVKLVEQGDSDGALGLAYE
jgi:hypothetical protein